MLNKLTNLILYKKFSVPIFFYLFYLFFRDEESGAQGSPNKQTRTSPRKKPTPQKGSTTSKKVLTPRKVAIMKKKINGKKADSSVEDLDQNDFDHFDRFVNF